MDNGREKNTAYFVAVGVAMTVTIVFIVTIISGHPEIFPLSAYLLLMIGFVGSGWPMLYEYMDRHSKWQLFNLSNRN